MCRLVKRETSHTHIKGQQSGYATGFLKRIVRVYVVFVTWFECRANIHAPQDQAKGMLGICADLSCTDVGGSQRECVSPSSTLSPCRAHSLVLSCDLNTVLGDRERAGGLDLPVMPYDKPLTSLTPSNITPLKGLSAYWLKNKKGDQKMLQALESLVWCSTSCLTLTPKRNLKVL